MIDFGGGFGVPYFEKMTTFDLDDLRAKASAGCYPLTAPDPRLAGCRFLFELGRYLVADAGVYVTRAVDVKETRGKTFVVTDGGMNHHLTATGNMGQVFRKAYPLLNLTRMGGVPARRASRWPARAARRWICSAPTSRSPSPRLGT